MNARRRDPYSRLGKRKKGKKEKKKGYLEVILGKRERERGERGELIETGHGRIPSNGSQ